MKSETSILKKGAFGSRDEIHAASWRCIGPDMYGYIIEVICDPKRPGRLYARSDVGGVLVSKDSGDSWVAKNDGLAPSLVNNAPQGNFAGKWGYYWHLYDGRYGASGLAIDPLDPDHLLLSTGGVFARRSVEGGARFGELFESWNGGETWQKLTDRIVIDGTGFHRVHGPSLLFDPEVPNRVYAGTCHDGVFVSEDGGTSWRYLGLRGRTIHCMAVHPSLPFHVIIGARNDISYWGARTIGGLWVLDTKRESTVVSALEGVSVRNLALSRGLWYAACECEGIFRSDDDGVTWNPTMDGLKDKPSLSRQQGTFYAWNSVAVRPDDPLTVYTSCLNTLATSRDGGETWDLRKPSASTVDVTGTDIGWEEFMAATSSISVDPCEPNRVFLTDFHGVWRSEDEGRHWQACPSGLANTCIKRIYPLRNEARHSRIAVAQTDGGLQISDDGVSKLRRVMGFKNAGVYCPADVTPEGLTEYSSACSTFAQHPQNPLRIYAAQNQAQHGGHGTSVIVRSDDGGVNWKPVGRGLPLRPCWIKDVVIDPFKPDILYCAVGGTFDDGGGVYVSEDAGETWGRRESEFARLIDFYSQSDANIERALVCDSEAEGRIYTAGRLGGLFQSDDRCGSWRDITENLPLYHSHGVGTLMYYAPKAELWAGLYDLGIWVLRGGRWVNLETGDFKSAKTLCFDQEGNVFAGFIGNWFSPSEAGILASRDHGATWTKISPGGLPSTMFSNIECDQYVRGRIYVGTVGNGVIVGDVNFEE